MRNCPNCGEPVPSNSLTCPKCYHKMPPETVRYETNDDRAESIKRGGKDILRLILTIVPAFFGFLGLGIIFNNYRSRLGYFVLVVGLVLYIIGVTMIIAPIIPVLSWLIGAFVLFLYFLLFLLSCLLTFGTVRTFGFR